MRSFIVDTPGHRLMARVVIFTEDEDSDVDDISAKVREVYRPLLEELERVDAYGNLTLTVAKC